MRFLNTAFLLAGLAALSAISSDSQPPPPPHICTEGPADPTTGLPTINCGTSGVNIPIPPVAPPVTTPPPASGPTISSVACAGPGLTPPGVSLLVETTPLTSTSPQCLTFNGVLVQFQTFYDAAFVASVVPTANRWGWYMANLTNAPPSSVSIALMVGTGFPNPAQANPPQPQ